eukprot:SAG31_NODE_375_length_16558_cov_6.855155_1_plen_2779_part_00
MLREIGITFNEDTKEYEGDIASLVQFMKKELKDDLPDHAISFIDRQGRNTKGDLSLSFYSAQIEKVLNSILVKRLVTSKVNGEALVQVASTLFENKDAVQSSFANPTKEDLEEYGTNGLRFYREGPNGETLPMDVKVSLRGKFQNLLDLEYEGTRIGNIETLNIAIKDEKWLNTGDHRQMITMTAVRIPVQGLNSMEFMQVREFLPAEAGNIIISPSEVVSKSGADYDVDKMTVMMPNIERKVSKESLTNTFLSDLQSENPDLDFSRDNVQMILDIVESTDYEALTEPITSLRSKREGDQLFVSRTEMLETIPVYQLTENDKKIYEIINSKTLTEVNLTKGDSKSAIENRLIKNISDILSLKSNYNNLVTPNSTALFTRNFEGTDESLVDTVGGLTREYNVKEYEMQDIPGDPDSIRKVISPVLPATSIFEYQYNMLKHQENKIGKEALGLGAVDNTYNILFNNVGAYMNPTNTEVTKEEVLRLLGKMANGERLGDPETEKLMSTTVQTILLDHNTTKVKDEDVISLSQLFPKGITSYSISDVINQLMNGWVDVAKGGWVFDVQATKEVSPTLLAMVQAGVPIDQAVYFVANPLTRAYVEKQKFVKSVVYDAVKGNPISVNKRNYRNIAAFELIMDPEFGVFDGLKAIDALSEADIAALEEGNIRAIKMILTKLQHKLLTHTRIRNNKNFTMGEMKNELTSFKKNNGFEDNIASLKSIQMLLHFIQLEKMALPIRDIKMVTNVDTSKDTTVFDAYDRQNKIEKIRDSKALPEEIVDKLLTDSAISPFYIQDLQLSLARILQPIRNSEELNKLLLIQAEDMDLSDKDMVMFKNDFIPFMWQREMNNKPLFNDPENPSYKRRDVKTELTVEKGILPKSGVAVKNGVIILDQLTLENQFNAKSFIDNQFFKNFGKAPIPSTYFGTKKDYIKFSIEREIQRELKPLNKKLTENVFFQNNLSVAESIIKPRKEETLDKLKSRQIKYAYESFLRDEALMSNFNIESIFKNPTGNFADRFFMVKSITPDLNKFKIFEAFELDRKKGSKISNLKYSEVPDLMEVNALKEEMSILRDADLLRASVPTLTDTEIQNIVDVFNDFPIVAFLQTGLNTGGRYSINNIVEEEYALYLENALNKKDFSIDVQDYKSYFNQLIKTKEGRAQLIRYKNFEQVTPGNGRYAVPNERLFDDRELYDILVPDHVVLRDSDVLIGNRDNEIIIKTLSNPEQAAQVSDAILKDTYKGTNAKVQKAILEKVGLVYEPQDIKNLLSTPERAYTFLLRYQKLYNDAGGTGNFFSEPSSVKGENIEKAGTAMLTALGNIQEMNEIFFAELRQKNIQISMRLLNAYQKDGAEFKYDSILEARRNKIDYTSGQAQALEKVQTLIDDVNKSKGTDPRYFLLAGYAGTGKTTIAENIQQYAIDQGFKVKIAAPTNKAVNVLKTKLEGKDKDFNTLHKMLYGVPVDGEFVFNDKSVEAVNNTIFIVDEASMINETLLRDLNKELNKGANNIAVFLGDSFQLAPVGLDPKLFEGMEGMEMVELQEVRRQSLDSDILTLATLMRTDQKAYEPTESTNDVTVIENRDEFEQKFIDDLKEGNDAVMLTGSNKDRVRVNNTVRKELYGSDADSVVPGESLIAIANRKLGFKNGETHKLDNFQSIEFEKVIDFGTAGKQKVVAVRMEGFDGIALIFPDAAKASMLSDDIMKGAVEDKEFMDYLYGNNMIAFDRMKEPYLSSKQDSPLTLIATYGYAITGHKSQGSQWDNVYVNQGNERNWGPRWMYTAITRAAKNLTIKKSKFATLITPKQMKSKIDEVIRKNATAPVSAPDINKDLNQSATEVSINTKRWTKDSPKENPATAYVFTENINSIGDTRVGKGSAVIRNNPNAIGIVTKKYYFYSENRNTPQALKIKEEYKGTGQWYNQNFQDTNADFELFQKINLEQFDKLDQFDSKKFPDGFANSLASVPNRFALWLQNQLKTRYGLITEVNDEGTGLISKSVIESPQKPVKTVSEEYGVETLDTVLSKAKEEQFTDIIQKQIKAQATRENKSPTSNLMFQYGLRWARVELSAKPLDIQSPDLSTRKNRKTEIEKLKKEGKNKTDDFIYAYHELDQNGNALPSIKTLKPIIDEIEANLGLDMSNYDAVIGNIYLPGQKVVTHRDISESASAKNYPVVVYTLGAGNAINVYENIGKDGKPTGNISFASDRKTTIPTKAGTIYTFGKDGKGRFELAHDTPRAISKSDNMPPITLPNGKVVKDYTITLTFRRAKNLEQGMPKTPAKISSTQKTVKGISISSNSNDTLGATLTNPTELAKSKGKISKSYPITYKNKTYKDVEEAYQALKDTSESKTKPDRFKSKNYALMVDLLQTKLATYTELPTAITAQGGTPWILGSTHQPTNQNTVWETGGQNWFIEALNESYTLVQSSLQSRDIDTSVKNLFTITPIQGRPDQKASVKASIATQYIGFADNIAGSSTANYAKQAGPFANTGEYNSNDVIFVSIGGERGAKKFRLAAQKKTISEAAFAVDRGAVIITDNKDYTFDPKNTYNSGERMLFEAMTELGYLYSEITIDGEVLGTWRLFDGSERKIQSKLVKSGDRSGYTTYPNFQQSVSSIKKYIPKGIMIVNGSIDPNDKPGTRTNDELILKEQINSLPLISMASYGLKSGQAFSNVIKDIEVNGVMKIDPKVQEAIDDRLDAIENRVSEDNVLEFSSEGYGMDMLKTLPNSEKRIGVQTWLYLSEELFKRFGYINPGYNTSASGSAVIESVNQDVSEQELIEKSDQAVLDFMKMCKI